MPIDFIAEPERIDFQPLPESGRLDFLPEDPGLEQVRQAQSLGPSAGGADVLPWMRPQPSQEELDKLDIPAVAKVPPAEFQSMRAVLGPSPVEPFNRGSIVGQIGQNLSKVFFDAPLVPFHKLDFDKQTVADALNMLGSASPELSQDEANEIQLANLSPDRMDRAVAGAQAGINDTLESLTTPFAVSTLGSGAVFKGLSARLLSAAFAADMARHTPDQVRQFRQAIDSGDPESIARSGIGLGLGGAFLYGAAKHALTPDSPARGAAVNLLKTAESGDPARMEAAAKEFAAKATQPARPVDFQPESGPQPAARVPETPPIEITPDALTELQAAMRGNQGKTSVFAQEPKAGTPSPTSLPSPLSREPAATEEMRAALEFQKRTDEAVRKHVENPDKKYDGMSSLELELLEGMGDAGATAERRRRRRFAKSREGEAPAEPKSIPAESASAPVDFVPEQSELSQPSGPVLDVPRMEEEIARKLVAGREAAGGYFTREALSRVLGVGLDTRIAPMVEVGLIFRTPQGYEFNERIQKLATAQQRSGAIDLTRPGANLLPESKPPATAETITGSNERTGSEMPAEPIQPGPPSLARQKIETDPARRQEIQNSIAVGDTFSIKGTALRVAGVDPDSGALTLEPVGGTNPDQFGNRPQIDPAITPQFYPDFGTYQRGTSELREGPDRLDLIAMQKYGVAYAELTAPQRTEFWHGPDPRGELPGRVEPGDVAGRERDTAGEQAGQVRSPERAAGGQLQRPTARRAELKQEIAYLFNEAEQKSTHEDVRARLNQRIIAARVELQKLDVERGESFFKLEANPRWRELRGRYDRNPTSLSADERAELRRLTEASDPIETALDKLKIDTDPSQLHAFGLIPEIWNGLVETVRLAYRGGKTIAQAIEDGLAWLKATHGEQRFDEAAARAAMKEYMALTGQLQSAERTSDIVGPWSTNLAMELDDALSLTTEANSNDEAMQASDTVGGRLEAALLDLPAGLDDYVDLYDYTAAATGSEYFQIRFARSNLNGELDWESPLRYSVRDHEPSPFREMEFGRLTSYANVSEGDASNLANAIGHRASKAIRRHIEILQSEIEAWREEIVNATAAPESGGAGIKAPSETQSQRPEGQAGKGNVSALRTEEASALTSESKPESAPPVNPSDKARPTDPIETALDKLKIDTDPSQLHAFGLIPEIWNGLVETVRLAYRGGKTIKEAIEHGLAWLRATHGEQRFDEAAVRTELENELNRGDAETQRKPDSGSAPPRLRGELSSLESEMRATEARGEKISQATLERYKELADTLGEDIRAGREPSGQGRAGTVDRNLDAAGGRPPGAAPGRSVPSFRGRDKLPGADLKDMFDGLQKWRHSLASWWQGKPVRRAITYLRDAAENRASQLGAQTANHVRLVLNRAFDVTGRAARQRNDLREYALTFAIQADRNRATLADWHELIGASKFADTTWGRRALKAIEYANEHWDRLAPAVEEYRTLSEAQREIELNAGVNVGEWKGGYVRMLIEGMDPEAAGGDLGPQAAGRQFTRKRTMPNYAEHIARGDKPKTLNALDLLAGRIADGQKVINEVAWLESMNSMIDPLTGEPVAQSVEWRPKRPIQTQGSQRSGEAFESAAPAEWEAHAPPGYHVTKLGPITFALHNDYGGLFTALTAPSWGRSSPLKQGVLQGVALAKHMTLLFDTFHLGRLAFWKTVITGKPTYGRGLNLIDYSAADIGEMARRGEIPEGYARELQEHKRILDLGVRNGFNIAGVWDNEHLSDVLHKLSESGVPGLSQVAGKLSGFNRWLFGQYQRGAMSEAFLMEYQRLEMARPEMNEAQRARAVAQDLNVRFGNLGRQGILKSKTAQDLARLLFLAPQWNESLIRGELGSLKQLGQIPIDVAKGRRLMVGTLLKATGTMIIGQFIANQILNYATRGKPTWENDEEGFGPKVSAWIPDAVGNGPGFFLNPLSIAAEYTHLVESKLHQTGGETDEALRRILNSRLSGAGRSVMTFITKKDELGRTLRGNEVWAAAGKALIPVPIGAGAYGAAGKQLVTGQPSEKYPGQFEKQALGSFGVKTDQAPNPEQRVRSLASSFNKSKGIIPSAEFYASDFADYTKALRIGNDNDGRDALEELLKKKTPKQVAEHFTRWVKAPYTGQPAREREFFQSLTPEQRSQYTKSRDDRRALAIKARAMLREVVVGVPAQSQ